MNLLDKARKLIDLRRRAVSGKWYACGARYTMISRDLSSTEAEDVVDVCNHYRDFDQVEANKQFIVEAANCAADIAERLLELEGNISGKEYGYTVEVEGLSVTFCEDSTIVKFSHIEKEVVSASIGEEAIQNLIQMAIWASKTAEDLQVCMSSIRKFYSHYLIDKSALNTLAWRIRNIDISGRQL